MQENLAKRGLYWTTKEGQEIHVEDMGADHAFNCFKMIFNHMVVAFRSDRLHRVAATVFYPGIEAKCRNRPTWALQYMEEFARILYNKVDMLSDANRELFHEIIIQLVPYWGSDWNNMVKQIASKELTHGRKTG